MWYFLGLFPKNEFSKMIRGVPGGLVVRILGFHCHGQVQSLVGELRSHRPVEQPPKRKKENK